MSEYTFDATLTIEAESEDQAIDLILDACMTDIDIACVLVKEGTLNVKELEAQVKENQKELLVFAVSAAKAQQGLYEDEEFPFTKAELRTKLSFAASFIATMSMDLRHTAIKGKKS